MAFRRWLSVTAAALAIALAAAAVYLATYGELRRPAYVGAATEAPLRRPANPGLPGATIELPLVRLSRVHVGVQTTASALGYEQGVPWMREFAAVVVLDTGASLAFGTAEIGAMLPLRTAPISRGARGFSGNRGALYPLEAGEKLTVSIAPRGSPREIITPVEYLAPAALHGAHVIAPPQALAPIGGAVLLDFERDRLLVCESLESCRTGDGWHPLALRSCGEDPELVGIDVAINGHALPMHLDTGAPTLLFRRYFDAANLGETTRSTEPGTLSGIGGTAQHAVLASGNWHFTLAAHSAIKLDAYMMWVVGKGGDAGPTHCFPAGSLGTDLLQGCQLVLSERPPLRGYARCSHSARRD